MKTLEELRTNLSVLSKICSLLWIVQQRRSVGQSGCYRCADCTCIKCEYVLCGACLYALPFCRIPFLDHTILLSRARLYKGLLWLLPCLDQTCIVACSAVALSGPHLAVNLRYQLSCPCIVITDGFVSPSPRRFGRRDSH